MRQGMIVESLHPFGKATQLALEELEVGERVGRIAGLQEFRGRFPIGGAEGYGKARIEAGDGVAGRPGIERVFELAAGIAKFDGESGGFFELAGFEKIGDGVHEVVDVVPIVIDIDVLQLHVVFVGFNAGGEGIFGAGVIAGAIEDVAGHVDHVAGGGSEASEDFGAVESLLGTRAGFDGVNPVVVGC